MSLVSGCALVGTTKVLQNTPQMTVTSPLFNEHVMPSQFTCYGVGESPPVFWSGAPPGTKSFALVLDDSATPITPYVYWIVFNISPGTEIQPGMIPPGAVQAENSAGMAKYKAPCPAGRTHQYRFTVYALNASLPLGNGAPLKAAWMAIASRAIARGWLTATAMRK
ncbi:MAG: YbhB/YbcL family Raf kinase inhibitor-like protein [Streptosporangiaceae bacterium]|jgi:Raf kinase inhibitor-like YbhB/YbcL family protein